MAKKLSCRDVGVDCDFAACADTEEELFRKTSEHARKDHGMSEIPKDLYEKSRAAIHAVERC